MTDLKSLPHDELLDRTRLLAKGRLELETPVKEHLAEIERRKLHVELGFQNVLEFFHSEIGAYGLSPSRPRTRRVSRKALLRSER